HATASGRAGTTWSLTWAVDAPDVSAAVPDGSGRLSAHGQVTGSRAAPRLAAALVADSLRWREQRVQHVAGNADVAWNGGAPSTLELDATGIHTPQRVIEHAAVHGDGSIADHRLTLQATSQHDSLALGLAGGVQQRTW